MENVNKLPPIEDQLAEASNNHTNIQPKVMSSVDTDDGVNTDVQSVATPKQENPQIMQNQVINNDNNPTGSFSNKPNSKDETPFNTTDDIKDPPVMMPTETYAVYEAFVDFINTLMGTKGSKISDEDNIMNIAKLTAAKYVNTTNMPVEGISENEFNNVVTNNEGRELVSHALASKPKEGRITGDAVAALAMRARGIGEPIHVPLWHSGFWITIRPPFNYEIVNFQLEISKNHITLGRDTSGLIYTNYSVVFRRIVSDFIRSHIQASSLKIADDEDIIDYIKVEDYYPIISTGLLYSMYPNGYKFIETCGNSMKPSDDGETVKCDYKMTANIDFSSMLYVNRAKITDQMMYHMSKRKPGSVTTNEVKEYQNIMYSRIKKNSVTLEGGIKIYFKSPSLGTNVTNGEAWVNKIISMAEKTFTTGTSVQDKNNIIEKMVNTVLLSTINTFISRIDVDESGKSFIDRHEDIDKFLEALSNDESILDEIFIGYKEYIKEATIAVTGIHSYVCPKCKKEKEASGLVGNEFKELVPLNMDEIFFALCGLRTNLE